MIRHLSEEELQSINEQIESALSEMEDIKVYLKNNKWTDKTTDKDKEEAFKFHTLLQKERAEWMDRILKITAITEFYERSRSKKTSSNVKKGSGTNSTMDRFTKRN